MQLSVTVNRVIYPPPTEKEASWFILATNQGICKGSVAWRPGEFQKLILEGEWAVYRGERQFTFKGAMLDVPTEPRAQLHYVCERTKGVGPALEIQIWDKLGEKWQEVQPGDVPKLKDALYNDFREQIEGLKGDQAHVTAVSWLMARGATQAMACAAWERWKESTIGVVQDNPFQLAELAHYGFKNVDGDIRKAFGIEDNDMRRIRAALVYALRRLTDDGSTVVAWDEVNRKSIGMLGGYGDLISQAATELFEDKTLIGFKGSLSVSLAADYWAEKDILEYVDDNENKEKP